MMKIAAVTDDGIALHSHFGQAPFYEVLTVECDRVTMRERRSKPAHSGHGHHELAAQSSGHVHAPAMAAVIADCDVLLARGMGEPAYRALQAQGINPMLVQEHTIDEAVQAYLTGNLQHQPERIHHH